MEITIKYFGLLAEVTRCSEEKMKWKETTVSEVLKEIYEKYPLMKQQDFKVAQNNKLVTEDVMISSTELALLPPFAGG